MDGARKNLQAEIGDSGFDEVCAQAVEKWENQLSKFRIETNDDDLRTIFYSCLHNVFLYPMLYSDVDGKFRGPDHEVHQADGFDYYAGVLGLWDNFRAANPLLTISNPRIVNEEIQTFLAHYNICGLLPIWTLAGHETLTMIGYHAMPIIADAYYKGIRDYDADAVFEAMKASANKDEFGLSMRRMMGTKNYKKYGYIPADLEFESVAQTLEFSYDDWCIAQMAKMLGRDEDYATFMERSKSYRNIIDPETTFARGRMTDGSWREPFDPRASTHRRDDYCEGNAWQWTFFVPHDPAGLAEIMGGKKELEKKLDGLFSAPSEIVGEHRSGDISGLIGQYAHGNEPSHHTAYLYDFVGAPWKTQNMIDRIMREMYANNPDGVCGNDDTGQMSAWYVFSAMGFYPVTHGTGRYEIGTPLLDRIVFRHGDNNEHALTIVAKNRTPENKYIQRILLDGKLYLNTYFRHEDIFSGDHEIIYEMTDDFTTGDFFTSGG
jgi:predicted alpha-1,2-mannosidase